VQSYPAIKGSIGFSIEDDWTFESDDDSLEGHDVYPTIELGLDILLHPNFLVHTDVTFEPVLDRDPFDDRFFGDLGIYVETLYGQFENDRFMVLAGKYSPSFGLAWDATPGLFGTDFAETYELSEKIGAAAAFKFGSGTAGSHTLQGNIFFADTTILSNSLFTERRQNDVNFGGASNTEQLDSFSITLSGDSIAALPGLAYTLGYSHQAAGTGDVDDENGYVFGLTKNYELGNGQTIDLVGEVAYLDHAFAGPDDAVFSTVGIGYAIGSWSLSAAYTNVWNIRAGASDFAEHLATTTVGYTFSNGIAVDLGYAFTEVANIQSHTIGLAVGKSFDFNYALKN
jgi:hypothetical protein